MSTNRKKRCGWVSDDPLYIAYHDNEWGVPVYDDKVQFEFLVLESAQAGLSWLTILKRREGYRRVFYGFDPQRVANMSEAEIATTLQDKGIIRNKLKVRAAVKNALIFLDIQSEFGSFTDYIWQFVGGKPLQNSWQRLEDVPVTTAESDKLSADLKHRGMSFVGSTIIYAHMQATGLVNDHTTDCFRYNEVIHGKAGNNNI